jgi:glutathione S-transferase
LNLDPPAPVFAGAGFRASGSQFLFRSAGCKKPSPQKREHRERLEESDMALMLHMHPLSSYCHKVLIALYENETAFTPHIVDLGDPQAKAAFVALWPTAKIPLLQDTTRARIVPETSIIIEYLDRQYPGHRRLLPADTDTRLEARLWDRLFDSYVMTPMQGIVADRLRDQSERDPRSVSTATATLHMAYDMIERHMASRTWAAGDAFSIADCAAAPALFYAGIIVPFAPTHVHLRAYFERLLSRPSVTRTIDEARPYFRYFPFHSSMPARFLADTPVHGD